MSEGEATTGTTDAEAQLRDAFAAMGRAIVTKDRAALEALHDPEFQATELHGRLMTAGEHIEAIIEGGELELEFTAITVKPIAEDLALAWGTQTLKGELRPEDMSAAVSDAVASGIEFAFTVVWRRGGERWRMLTYHVSQLPLDGRPGDLAKGEGP